MANDKRVKCRRCDRRYSRLRRKCPYCGAKKRGNSKRAIYDTTPKWQMVVSIAVLIAVIIIVAVLIVLSIRGDSKDKDTSKDDTQISDNVDDSTINSDNTGVNDIVNDTQQDTNDDTADMPVKVESITLDHTDFTMTEIGQKVTIVATISPEGAEGTIEWASGNEEVCQVSSGGVVTAINKGTTTVWAEVDGIKSAECIVRVTAGSGSDSGDSSSETLKISHTDVTISSAKSETFVLSVSGNSGTPTYSSGNTSVATVTATGRVTAIASGTTIVTVTVDGQSLECIVRVN